MKTYLLLAVILLNAGLISPRTASAACTATVPASTPDSSFVDNGDGTVTDVVTGLTWKRCSEGQTWSSGCTGSASTYSAWHQALQAGASSSFAGKSDWRLPNMKELDSIVERQCSNPAINENIFPGTMSAGYWTSSPAANAQNTSWNVLFSTGIDDTALRTSGNNYVRLVRGGQ